MDFSVNTYKGNIETFNTLLISKIIWCVNTYKGNIETKNLSELYLASDPRQYL